MRDFKYLQLVTDNPIWEPMLSSLEMIVSPHMKDCAIAFKENIERTASFAVLPVELFWQGSRNTRMTANAIFNSMGIGAMALIDQMELQPTPDMILEFAKKAGVYERMSPDALNSLRFTVGINQVDRFLKNNEHMRASMDALFTSIVLEAWLFFESLASDLWVVAVDCGGPVISGRVLQNQKWEKGDMLASAVPLAESNPKTHPGSYRREIGLVSFQKLRSIKDYYKVIFGESFGKVFDDTAGGYIFALSAVRNAIAHNAGRVDGQFKKATERFPEWKQLKMRDRILLDGESVKKLRNAALETGVAMLKHVDSALQAGE